MFVVLSLYVINAYQMVVFSVAVCDECLTYVFPSLLVVCLMEVQKCVYRRACSRNISYICLNV